MKPSTAALLAGVSIAVVGVAQLVQKHRQHKQDVDTALSLIQIEWLSRASADPLEAAFWAPEGVEPEQYQRMLSGNRMLCQLSLRWRLGVVTRRQLDLYADNLMANATCRDYWQAVRLVPRGRGPGQQEGRSVQPGPRRRVPAGHEPGRLVGAARRRHPIAFRLDHRPGMART